MERKKKKKEYQKTNIFIIVIFSIIIIFLLFILIKGLIPKEKLWEDDEYIFNDNTINKYLELENSNVYLYNLDELNIKYQNKYISLKDYYAKFANDNEKVFADLAKNLRVKVTLKDGGTIIYQTKDEALFQNNLTIVKCHTKDGNIDTYFGKYMNTTEAFKHGMCGKNFFEDASFTRNYIVTNIEDIKDDIDYNTLLTLKDKEGKEASVKQKLSDKLKKTLKKDEEYVFSFENKYHELIKEDISDIFNKCIITNIEIVK